MKEKGLGNGSSLPTDAFLGLLIMQWGKPSLQEGPTSV